MARDTNLQLEDAAVHTTTETTAAIDVEGGFRADVRLKMGVLSTGADTDDIEVQASVDGGSNYFQIATFPQIVDTDDQIEIARSCYIPKPDAGELFTKVRLSHTVSAGGSFAVTWAFVEPLMSIAVQDIDEVLTSGLALLT